MTPTDCRECGAAFAGPRDDARRAGWEPYSRRTQRDLDHGPMICPECVSTALSAALDAFHGDRDAMRVEHDRVRDELAYLDALPRPKLPPCPPWCARTHESISPAAIDIDLHTIRVVHSASYPLTAIDAAGEPGTVAVIIDHTETLDLSTGAQIADGVPEIGLMLSGDTLPMTADSARRLAADLAATLTRAADALDAAQPNADTGSDS